MPAQEELLLVLGLKITITIHNEPYLVALRGWSENRYLIIDSPKVKKPVASQTGCHVHFIRDGVVVTFKSVVEFIRLHENGFMLLKFPANYEKIKMRKVDRIKTRLPVSYLQSVSGKVFKKDGVVLDLSMSGILMSHAEPLLKGDTINLNLPLPNGAIDNMESNVCNVRQNPKNLEAPYVTGIKFLNLVGTQMDMLKKHILSTVGSGKPDFRALQGSMAKPTAQVAGMTENFLG